MNENLNLAEILKDCPTGTKLYSTIFGEVTLDKIKEESKHPIIFITTGGNNSDVTADGRYYDQWDGECTLFPSKEQRDWSKFKPTCEFKDGDIVATNTGNWIGITTGGRVHSFIPTYCVFGNNREVKLYFGRKEEWGFDRLATEEEKQRLFDAIKERGYKWNAETKTLKKLVKPKFDPKTLNPFDKVLVRDFAGTEWSCDLFSYIENIKSQEESFICTGGISFNFCIPYNDDTKHLVGTDSEAPEYYRYWED